MEAGEYQEAAKIYADAARHTRYGADEEAHSFLKLAIAQLQAGDLNAADTASADALASIAAGDGESSRFHRDATALRAAILMRMGRQDEAERLVQTDIAASTARSGDSALAVDSADADLVHGASGARYPERTGGWLRQQHSVFAPDGSDIAVNYQSRQPSASLTVYQTAGRGSAEQYAVASAQAIEMRFPGARETWRGPVTLSHPQAGWLSGYRVIYEDPTARSAAAHSVMAFQSGEYLMKLRLTTDVGDATAAHAEADELVAALRLPR